MIKCIYPSPLLFQCILATLILILLLPQILAYIPFNPSFYTPDHKIPDISSSSNEEDSDSLEHRIVGGRPAKEGEAPYQISLMLDDQHICGATLVMSPNGLQFAISAAHCVTNPETSQLAYYPYEYLVRAGSVNRHFGQTLRVSTIIFHEKWSYKFRYDIALIFFHGSFTLSDTLYPIELGKGREKFDEIFVSGWGYEDENDPVTTDILKIVKLPVIGVRRCANRFRQLFPGSRDAMIHKSNICAGYALGKKDACIGDSGGPAVARDGQGVFLVAVVSFGQGCARRGVPGVYTRIASYLGWISRVVSYIEVGSGIQGSNNNIYNQTMMSRRYRG